MTNETETESVSHYRIAALLLVGLTMVLVSSFVCFLEQLTIDLWICGYVLDLIFFLVVLFEIEYERNHDRIAKNKETTLVRFGIVFAICGLLTICGFYVPAFFRPFLLFPVLLYSVSSLGLSMTCSLYYVVVSAVFFGFDSREIALYVLLIGIGNALVCGLEERRFLTSVSFVFALSAFFLPELFYYFSFRELLLTNLIYGAIDGIAVFFVSFFLFRSVRSGTLQEEKNRMDDILSDRFSEVVDLKNYSVYEYAHAMLVSKICYKCAKRLELDADVSAAAGFYYRLGKWKGEPHVENGVTHAKKLCFPKEVVWILEEYYGEKKLPSNQESALVYIVDAAVKKMQALHKSAESSAWNYELLIYQTLNEISQSGILDRSGLSMNQYLKIRELLAKEDLLIEFLS